MFPKPARMTALIAFFCASLASAQADSGDVPSEVIARDRAIAASLARRTWEDETGFDFVQHDGEWISLRVHNWTAYVRGLRILHGEISCKPVDEARENCIVPYEWREAGPDAKDGDLDDLAIWDPFGGRKAARDTQAVAFETLKDGSKIRLFRCRGSSGSGCMEPREADPEYLALILSRIGLPALDYAPETTLPEADHLNYGAFRITRLTSVAARFGP